MGARILVTGATGFVGTHLCHTLERAGHEVFPTSSRPRQGVVHLDLRDPCSITSALTISSPQIVFHAAAYGVDYRQQDLHAALKVNLHGTLALFEACAAHGVRRFVHLGTAFEYVPTPCPLDEDAALGGEGVYARTKLAGALILQERARSTPCCALLVLRLFGMFGPGEGAHKLAPQVVRACLLRQPLAMGEGSEVRDYVDVRQACQWIVALGCDHPCQGVINLGSGQGQSIRAFALSLARELGAEEMLTFGALPPRAESISHVVCDPRLLHTLLPQARTLWPRSVSVRDLVSSLSPPPSPP